MLRVAAIRYFSNLSQTSDQKAPTTTERIKSVHFPHCLTSPHCPVRVELTDLRLVVSLRY